MGKQPPRLREWIKWETHKEKIIKAVEEGEDFPSELFGFLSAAWGINYKWFEYADWHLIILAFYSCISKSPQVNLPITVPTKSDNKEEAWDYPERTWHLYSHLLAKTYGWTLGEISQLQVEEALAKIQEIVVDDQLDREFYYGLSEVAYRYDKATKKSNYVPLPRPSWMRPRVEPEKIKKFKIPKTMLPMGNVITDGVLPPELMPKELN